MPAAVSRQPATLQLKQQLTRVSGSAKLDGKDVPLEEVKLRGDRLTFRVTGRKGEFTGQVKGRTIEGMLDGFNMFNVNTITAYSSGNRSVAGFTQPTTIVPPRVFRIGTSVNF